MDKRLNRLLPWRQALVLCLLCLTGCAVAPLPQPDAPAPLPAAFKGAMPGPGGTTPLPSGGWWKLFEDPQLDALMARALANNASIEQATARLARARALARLADAGLLPTLDMRAGASRQGGPLVNAAGDDGSLFTAGVAASWEIDLLGRLAQARRAAQMDAAATQSLLRDAQLLVQIELVRHYLALRALDAEAVLAREQVESLHALQAVYQRRLQNGQVAQSALTPLRLQAAAAGAELPDITRRRTQHENALATLLGEVGSSFTLVADARRVPVPEIPAGVPMSVLTRRPDVAAALDTMLAARERVGQAAATDGPQLQLSGTGGLAASGLGPLLSLSARAWSLGALVSLPLFDGGRRAAGTEVAQADFRLAQAQYRARYLGAVQEVEDQLAAAHAIALRTALSREAALAAGDALATAQQRLVLGTGSEAERLLARQTDLRQQRAMLQMEAEQQQAAVALVHALGGAWD